MARLANGGTTIPLKCLASTSVSKPTLSNTFSANVCGAAFALTIACRVATFPVKRSAMAYASFVETRTDRDRIARLDLLTEMLFLNGHLRGENSRSRLRAKRGISRLLTMAGKNPAEVSDIASVGLQVPQCNVATENEVSRFFGYR